LERAVIVVRYRQDVNTAPTGNAALDRHRVPNDSYMEVDLAAANISQSMNHFPVFMKMPKQFADRTVAAMSVL
jgi:hypothetical protein